MREPALSIQHGMFEELYAFGKIRSRDLPPIVAFYIEEACNTGLGLTAEEKDGLLLKGLNPTVDNLEFELKGARFLEELKQEGQIADWIPSEKNSPLDRLKIDFIVVRAGTNQAVGLQVTSSDAHATERRKKIKELYEKPIIPVVHLRLDSISELDEKSFMIKEQEMKNWIVEIINKNPFFVEINMPEKEAEPLFPSLS